ncbi:MAG: NUDIX hydrolase [Phycisphaerae bacterium]|nr:NUDIX hydrolase [Phycisphaerae bacterium]
MLFDWFHVVSRLKAIAQTGKTYARDEFELKRHGDIQAIATEIIAHHTDLEANTARKMLQDDTGYPTPKVDCRGVIFKEEKILLVREIEDGGWTLPGGWCDNGMTPSENVEREVWEESGFKVRAVRLLSVFDRNKQGHTPPYPFNIYKMFFLCEIVGGAAKTSNETSDVQFFGQEDIPPLSIGRTLPHQIKRFYEQYRHADDLSADFD